MKLRCVCDQDYMYDHTKAGQQFRCSWCGQVITMPLFESLSAEDQGFYRNELQKQHEKAQRATEKAERKQQAAAAKEAARQRTQREEEELRKRREAEERIRLTKKKQEEQQYAFALVDAKKEPDKPKVWFCSIRTIQHGPMQEAMVQKWIDDGTLSSADYVRTENSVTWLHVSDLPERFHVPRPSAVSTVSTVSTISTVKCPKCGCAQLSSNKKGMDAGVACCGALALGPLGLLCGLSGANTVIVTCLNCGYQWRVRK